MAIRKHSTGTVTMTGATGTSTITNVHGKIVQVAIKPSGTATGFKISFPPATGLTHYILGTSVAAVSVAAAGAVFYPVDVRSLTDDGTDLTADANIYAEVYLNADDITVSVSAGATSETYEVVIYVEE